MTAREAMAYGRPVVATAVGGLTDAVDDGETGLLVAEEGLRGAIERLLGDDTLRQKLGGAARLEAEARFGFAAAAAELLRVYRTTL